jgi:hypothetical protein
LITGASQEVAEKYGIVWLGREGSNLRMTVSKTVALPLGDAPTCLHWTLNPYATARLITVGFSLCNVNDRPVCLIPQLFPHYFHDKGAVLHHLTGDQH